MAAADLLRIGSQRLDRLALDDRLAACSCRSGWCIHGDAASVRSRGWRCSVERVIQRSAIAGVWLGIGGRFARHAANKKQGLETAVWPERPWSAPLGKKTSSPSENTMKNTLSPLETVFFGLSIAIASEEPSSLEISSNS